MRFLAPDGNERPVVDSAPNVMRAIVFVCEIDGQFCRHFQKVNILRAHHFQNRRPHELQKSDKRRHGISWQTEYSTATRLAEEKWFSWFNRDAPDVDLGSQRA
jgi:hypothetical protein